MAGDFTISWLGQPFPTHHSSQQRWTTESKMILRICMAHCTSQPDWKVPFLDIHPHISWSVYVDINLNCRCWQWWRRVKKLANLSTRKQWLVTHVFSWKQTKDLAFMTLISLLSNTKSGCRNPFSWKSMQNSSKNGKMKETLGVSESELDLKIPLELSKKKLISQEHCIYQHLAKLAKKPWSCIVGFFLLNIQPNFSGHELKASHVFLWAFVQVCQVFEVQNPSWPLYFQLVWFVEGASNEPTPFCWSHLASEAFRITPQNIMIQSEL